MMPDVHVYVRICLYIECVCEYTHSPPDLQGQTPLHLACLGDRSNSFVRVLVDGGASCNVKDTEVIVTPDLLLTIVAQHSPDVCMPEGQCGGGQGPAAGRGRPAAA